MYHSIELRDIYVRLGHYQILSGVSIEARPCEFISIIGANGAGKTTLLKVINGVLRPFEGRVSILGYDLSFYKRLNFLRRDIGVVPQRLISTQFPLRVEEAVLMGRYGKVGLMRRPTKEDREKAFETMELLGIKKFYKKLVYELSGGEQQKVALARALAQEPLILLLDEPTTYLDGPSQSEIMEIIHSIHHQRGLTTVLVSHDVQLVERYSDKIYLLREGKSSLIK
jgi:ABC-type cobalamin/Fe3+-siderophores transport system ATPase subunit